MFSRRLVDFPVLFWLPTAGPQLSWNALPRPGQRPQLGCCCSCIKQNKHFTLVADYTLYISIMFAFISAPPPSQWHFRFIFNFFHHPFPLLSLPTQSIAVLYFFICFKGGIFTEQRLVFFFSFSFFPKAICVGSAHCFKKTPFITNGASVAHRPCYNEPYFALWKKYSY